MPRISEVGRWRTFGGVAYKLKSTARTKSELKKTQRRWGAGRIAKLPKGSSDYKQGDRYGLYMQA